jgi:glycosyltransferase involved in cell wall biosynthesis
MVATSYPRFDGDTVGTFMPPIAEGLAALGHEIHLVLPWHPRWARSRAERGVIFHPFKYAPLESLNAFGYAGSLNADVSMKTTAVVATPLAVAAGVRAARRVIRDVDATLVHAHWVVPGGVMAAAACGGRPLVISLHGSDVYMAERHRVVGAAARRAFARAAMVTACSDDLRLRAFRLGADADRAVTIPYGVDTERFRPRPDERSGTRRAWGAEAGDEVVFAAGRFVKKKGFEYLLDAVAALAPRRARLRLVLAGGGDLEGELRDRIHRLGLDGRVTLPGIVGQDDVGRGQAAADVVVVPSIRDDAGNVDGLPNVVMEALASGTPVVATPAGGIASVVQDNATGLLVPERDPGALSAAIEGLLADPARARRLGTAAREWAISHATWASTAESFDRVYERASGSPR